jgi:PelA/Pel-15E family pectate lyase
MAWIAALSLNLVPAGANRRSVATAGVAILAMIGVWAAEAWGRKLLDSLATSDVWRYPILLARSPPDSWVAADNLVDAYRAGRLVPPELAVWSDKRQDAGLLPMEAIVSTLEARRPERLLLRRFNVPRIFRKYLAIAYSRMPVVESASGRRPVRFYVRATPNPADAARSPAAEALLTATEALRFLAPNGGFAGHYDLQSGMAWGRVGEPMVPGTVLIRPPASTQEVGSCFLRAHRITGAPLFWDAAKQAGNAIACSQGRYGGWAAVAHRNETCGPHGGSQDDVIETLDDGASQSAVRFLMDLAAAQATKTDRPPFWLADGIGRGLDFFLTAQDENGGWPQQYPKSDEDDYSNYATLNDGVVTEVISTLLHAYRQTGHKRYRSAAKRGGDFLLKAQGPPSQPAWAQQYDDKLRPAAARAFEPAAYGSEETGFAMNALLDLYAATGDDRFLKGLAAARDWLERSTIRPGTWARLYEIGTNRPIYGDHDGKVHYTLAEISEERRAGYRWEGAFPSVTRALARYQALRGGGREGLRRQTEALEREAHRQSHEEALARVPELVSSVRPGQGWIDNGIVDTNTFIENCRTILNALETATR